MATETMDPECLVRIRDLRVSFKTREGEVRALRGLDLDLSRKRTVGVVGESGCGKSITGQSILRIVQKPGAIVGGSILVRRAKGEGDIVDVASADPRGPEMRSIRGKEAAIIFQEPMTALSPVHTIGNQMAEAIPVHETVSARDARKRCVDLLRRVGIPKAERRIDCYTFELSGGQRQRAMIAMALACNPSLLIADEPTTALDVTMQAQILDLLRELQGEFGMGVMMITHNLGVVAEIAHEVAVMYLGRAVERSSTANIFDRALHPYTQGLLKSIPRLGAEKRERLWAIDGIVPHPYARIEGCPFHPRCPDRIPGLCDTVLPPTEEVSAGHSVACHLYATEPKPNA